MRRGTARVRLGLCLGKQATSTTRYPKARSEQQHTFFLVLVLLHFILILCNTQAMSVYTNLSLPFTLALLAHTAVCAALAFLIWRRACPRARYIHNNRDTLRRSITGMHTVSIAASFRFVVIFFFCQVQNARARRQQKEQVHNLTIKGVLRATQRMQMRWCQGNIVPFSSSSSSSSTSLSSTNSLPCLVFR